MSDFPRSVRSSEQPLDRRAVARDLWPGGTLDLWQGRAAPLPDRVAWPDDEEGVCAVLEWASAHGVPVIPYGAGSGVCGGARGQVGAVTLDTKALQHMGPVDPETWTVECGAGTNGQQLEDHLNRQGFTLGHSPSSIWCSTVGGWAAARSAGQFSSKYGVFEDMVLSMRVCSPGRGAFTVGVDGDAPDEWMPVLLGSEGTLGVVTSLRLRVWPLPERQWLRGYRFSTVSDAIDAMRRLMQGELWPSVVRLYDPVDTRIGGKTKPKSRGNSSGFLKRWLAAVDHIDFVHRNSLSLPLALPGLVNRLFDGLASGCLLIVGWEGREEVVEALSAEGHALLCERGEDLGEGPGQRWFQSRHAVSYKLMPIFERGGFADTMEVATHWSNVVPLYEGMRKALGENAVVMAHMSHAYPEGCCIYFSFAGAGDRDTYDRHWRTALDAVVRLGGTVTHHHGVGFLKADAVSREVGPAIAGWRELKQILDPRGVLNPGRVFVETAPVPPPTAALTPTDGLVRVQARQDVDARAASVGGHELMWPWERLDGLPRWHRLPWQTTWIEVRGSVDGQPCVLGRGPRSASGSDLRPWLVSRDAEALATVAVTEGERWMGEGRPEHPWQVARHLLRSDLRPAVLTVDQGVLRVGFRGPASAALGRLASQWVPGGLSEVTYESVALPCGPLEHCEDSADDVVAVLPQGSLRRRT